MQNSQEMREGQLGGTICNEVLFQLSYEVTYCPFKAYC